MRQLWMAVIVAVTIILLVGCEEARPTTEKLLGTCKGTAKEDLKRFKIEVEPLLKKASRLEALDAEERVGLESELRSTWRVWSCVFMVDCSVSTSSIPHEMKTEEGKKFAFHHPACAKGMRDFLRGVAFKADEVQRRNTSSELADAPPLSPLKPAVTKTVKDTPVSGKK